MASVQLHNVNKSYDGKTQVLCGIDLDIADGEFVVLVGPSGCGKSTLLRTLCGLERASSGDIRIGDRSVNHLQPAERGVAMVFQSYALYPHMTVYKNMAFGLRVAGADKATIERRIRDTAEALQIAHLLGRLPRELSGGQRQRVAIGRAIVREPQLFLFDEPLSNLDAALRVQTRIELARLHRRLGATVVYVTHDQVEAMTLGDRIVVMDQGRVQQAGTPLQLYQHPCNRFVASFIGSPRMNLLQATVLGASASEVACMLADGTRLTATVDGSALHAGQPVTLGVRPEHLVVDGHRHRVLCGRVDLVEHLGEVNLVHLTLPGGVNLIARCDGASAVRAGDELALSVEPHLLHLFDESGLAMPRLLQGASQAGPSTRLGLAA
jgi:ABC-type sugar transport system ATPase subunit